MKTEIEIAIRALLGKMTASVTMEEALKFTQSMLNLAHTAVTLATLKDKQE
jgi:hypothetical protein